MNPEPLPKPQTTPPITFPRKVPRKPRAVDFTNNRDDHECALLASMGYSTAFICRKTGLSECQVMYRIRAAGLTKENHTSRSDFRNGTSPFSGLVLYAVQRAADAELIRHLKKYT